MTKYRSKTNFATIYAGDKQGYNLGLDSSLYLRKETTQRSFIAPRIGTQGSSIGGASASTDITGLTTPHLRVALRGAAAVQATLVVTGADTGDEVAAALELAINTALIAAGSDHRVWARYVSSDQHYEVYDQETGTASTVVITDGLSTNVADDLKLGVANGGTEAAGTADQDYVLMTSGGPKFQQDIESNQHRSGRFHRGIVRKKKMADFDFETYLNMAGNAGASLDAGIALLWENLTGDKTVVASTSIDFRQGLPNFTMSLVRASTIFGEYYTGAYCKGMDLHAPGNAPATCKWSGKAATCSTAGLAQILGNVAASTSVILQSGQGTRYSSPQYASDGTTVVSAALVMVVDPDGRTIIDGAAGDLSVLGIATDTLTLSRAVTVTTLGYVVPWDPGAVQQTGTDAIYTDLNASFRFDASGSDVDVTDATLSWQNNHNDLDDRLGADANRGFVAGNRADIKLSVKFDLSAGETLGKVIQARGFAGLTPRLIIGDGSTSRKLTITAPKWIVSVPPIDVPQNGPTPVTMEGMLFESTAGARDPILASFS